MKTIKLVNKEDTTDTNLLDPMFELRHAVFKEKLDWKVNSENNREVDEYDKEKDANYVVVTDDNEEVVGCMRLLPTTGPYMLKNTFPDLAKKLINLPERKDVWEISRFAVENKSQEKHSLGSFGDTTKHLAKGMCDFAVKNDIAYYVGLTTPHVERLIKNLGLTCNRMGEVQMIDDLKVVAIEIIMDEKGIKSVQNKLQQNQGNEKFAIISEEAAKRETIEE